MALGHCGPHKVGGPYNVTETFVIKCKDKPCDYHPNSREINHKTGERERWLECIHCGDKKPRPVDKIKTSKAEDAKRLRKGDSND